jgi:hypothetical protein
VCRRSPGAVHRWGGEHGHAAGASPRSADGRAPSKRRRRLRHQPAALVFGVRSRHAACDVLAGTRRGATAPQPRQLGLPGQRWTAAREAQRHGARVAVFPPWRYQCARSPAADAPAWFPKVIVTDGAMGWAGRRWPPARRLCPTPRTVTRPSSTMDESARESAVLGRPRAWRAARSGWAGGGLLPVLRGDRAPHHRRRHADEGTRRASGVRGRATRPCSVTRRPVGVIRPSQPAIHSNVARPQQRRSAVHDPQGNRLRQRLSTLVRRFRAGLRRVGLEPASRSLFPIQTVAFTNDQNMNSAPPCSAAGSGRSCSRAERDERHVLRFLT